MIYTISNEYLAIKIDSIGAELKSIKSNNVEYLWQGSNSSWKRTSPILFPIVGALNNDKYTVNSTEFTLTQHGFARDMEFSVVEESSTKILLKTSWNNQTYKLFPYKFQLILGYELLENSIKVIYQVTNTDTNSILFSIGAHPGFNCPIDNSLDFSDYKLTLNNNENSYRRFKNDKVITGEKGKFFNNNNSIDLKHSLFKQGALIFDDLNSTEITLESNKDRKKVTMNFEGFPYFGVLVMAP